MYNYVKGCGMVILGFGIICGTTDLIQGNTHSALIIADAILLVIGGLLSGWEED